MNELLQLAKYKPNQEVFIRAYLSMEVRKQMTDLPKQVPLCVKIKGVSIEHNLSPEYFESASEWSSDATTVRVGYTVETADGKIDPRLLQGLFYEDQLFTPEELRATL